MAEVKEFEGYRLGEALTVTDRLRRITQFQEDALVSLGQRAAKLIETQAELITELRLKRVADPKDVEVLQAQVEHFKRECDALMKQADNNVASAQSYLDWLREHDEPAYTELLEAENAVLRNEVARMHMVLAREKAANKT